MSSQRLNNAWKALHANAPGAFDVEDELQVDVLACHLLERYRGAGDAEAFALLFKLMRPRLARLAARLLGFAPRATQHGAPDGARDGTRHGAHHDARADALVAALMRAVHREGRQAPPLLSGFLVLAAGRMRRLLPDPVRPDPCGEPARGTTRALGGPLARSA